jgi:hypothetical protein
MYTGQLCHEVIDTTLTKLHVFTSFRCPFDVVSYCDTHGMLVDGSQNSLLLDTTDTVLL